jgi:hypothetical protein
MCEIGLPAISLGVVVFVAIQFLLSLWIGERLKTSLQKENMVFLEKIRWELKVREQAERVAEYLAIASDLKETDPPEKYQRVNRLNWELAMWLPENLYKAMVDAIIKPNKENNTLSVVVGIRKYLLGDIAGQLSQDNIGCHGPGIGKKTVDNKLLETNSN